MRKYTIAAILLAVLLLGACNNQEKKPAEKGESDDSVGFTVEGGTIEEAADVPADEKEALKEAFATYIATFNEKDVDGYMGLISQAYDHAEEEEFLTKHFESYDQTREASDVTVIKYQEDEAQVFAVIQNHLKEIATEEEMEDTIRQVTVFTKEDGQWKIKSVHSIGEN